MQVCSVYILVFNVAKEEGLALANEAVEMQSLHMLLDHHGKDFSDTIATLELIPLLLEKGKSNTSAQYYNG